MLCAANTWGSSGNRILRRLSDFSSVVVSLGNCSLDKRRIRLDRRNAHQTRRHDFTVFAMPFSGDSDDEPQTSPEITPMSSKYPCMYVKSAVSSGETIEYPGTIVILGDVHEGGAIVAGGDIVVVGRLRGSVHGGRNGDRGAVVYATQLDACHIRIADATFVTESHFSDRPAIASIQEDGKLDIRAAVRKFEDSKSPSNSCTLNSAVVKQSLQTSKGSESKDLKFSRRPAQLALFTGVYISVVGMALLAFPTFLFGALFDVRSVTVGWIRVGAILAVVFGVYYIGTAIGDLRGRSGARAFYTSTVVGRVFLFFGFCWLVAVGAAQPALVMVGTVNMLGAMSMLFALRQAPEASVPNT